jgi:putative sterol carrier protein
MAQRCALAAREYGGAPSAAIRQLAASDQEGAAMDLPERTSDLAVDPNELARNLAQASDEQLDQLMSSELREQILDEIFSRMEQHYRGDADTEAVIHWRIKGGSGDDYDRRETVIANGTCTVNKSYTTEDARVTFTIGGGDFLKLVTGNAAGPTLFITGKLKIKGDMMFAASAAGLFTIPNG